MPVKESVNTIIQNSEGKYLLQMRDGTEGICNPLKWNFFGGGLRDNENPVEGAARETKEELDIEIKQDDFKLLGKLRPKKERFVYVVEYKQPVNWQDITVQEGAGAGYFTKYELLKLDITAATKMLVKKFL